jgi:hypothetical protein
MADDIGTQDQFAIVTSVQPLDVFQLNDAINQNKSIGFENAVTKVAGGLGQAQFSNSTNGTIKLTSPIQNNKTIVACIVSVNKID